MDAKSETEVETPQTIYQRRREALRVDSAALDSQDRNYATARGLVFLSGLALAIAIWNVDSVVAWWLLLPVGVFIGLVIKHARINERLEHVRRAIVFYDRALDRLEDRWAGVGSSGDRYVDHHHAYSSDLDLFGEGSLFQLMCGSRTRLGEDALSAWLSAPADADTVRARQVAVAELRGQLMFREDLAVLDAEVHDELDQNNLREWGLVPAQPYSVGQRIIATVLGVLAAITLMYWITGGMISPFLSVVVIELLFYAWLGKSIRQTLVGADLAGSGLAILGQVLHLLEQQQFSSPFLATRCEVLKVEGQPPSKHIRRLRNLIQNLSACLENQFFAPIAFVLGIPVHVAHAIEIWRERVGRHLSEWLSAVGEIEAVTSISSYAFERPHDVVPELLDASLKPTLIAEGLGHPLISQAKCIRNDVRFDEEKSLLMISGSNMSGKSTYLRTIGINVVLAWSGAPVCATLFCASRLQVGTEMRIHDSLQHGVSLFYSVISRLKAIVELADREPPLLFLLDEILQGTNSHDRRVGAEGIIKQLVRRGAVGLVTTHDLALTRIVDAFDGSAANMHFEDHLINGKMYFDHRIRPGVVQKSNALELMRMIGLDVPDE